MTARDILKLLEARHSKDVFIPECKDGATLGTSHLRMDAWAMKRSWSKPLVTAYEIKVNRQDFLRDDKWHEYLGNCNEFYFVCPPGLIASEELPAEAGLLYTSKNGARLYMKKKAPRRDVQIPESVFRYIVMCRSTFTPEPQTPQDKMEYWKNYLSEKEERKHVGYMVSKAVREHIDNVNHENARLKNQIHAYAHIEQRIKELGLDPLKHVSLWEIDNRLDKLMGRLPGAERVIDNAITHMQKAKDILYPPPEDTEQ